MKLSDILLLTLFCVMGSMIFAIKQMHKADETESVKVPVPALKPEQKTEALNAIPQLRLDYSTPNKPGSYGRLPLDKFLVKSAPEITRPSPTPKVSIRKQSPAESVIKPSQKKKDDHAQLQDNLPIKLGKLQIETADAVNLPYLPEINENRFVDRVVDMAEVSPVQPDARGCGSLNHSLGAKKEAKVRSLAMQRQLTDRTSIGVEYVYKDGCYKNAIAPLKSLDMPSDDGVNLRINMRF